MKPIYCVAISVGLFFCVTLLASGCAEPQADDALIRRARLVADENIELRKQLEQKDRRIAQLEQELQDAHEEMLRITEQTGRNTRRLLEITAEAERRAEQLREENERLKERLDQLKNS